VPKERPSWSSTRAPSGERLQNQVKILIFYFHFAMFFSHSSIQSSSYWELGQHTPCNLLRKYVICRSELQYHCNPKQKRQQCIYFVLKVIHVSATTEYINLVHQFYIFCTKGDSLQISAILLEMITFAISYSSKTQSADRKDMTIDLHNCLYTRVTNSSAIVVPSPSFPLSSIN
jgi:hypothetical protein